MGLYLYSEERDEILKLLKEQGFVRNFRNTLKTKSGKELIRYLSLSQMTISNKEHIFSVQTEAPIEFFDT
ncbi:hypothetical protein ACO2KH_05485 [Leptospira terpstrae]|uniref:hypothetical protein n=1 Tax=Leptospira terpstrae TaxID=293075 RepID=UPI003D03EEF6